MRLETEQVEGAALELMDVVLVMEPAVRSIVGAGFGWGRVGASGWGSRGVEEVRFSMEGWVTLEILVED